MLRAVHSERLYERPNAARGRFSTQVHGTVLLSPMASIVRSQGAYIHTA